MAKSILFSLRLITVRPLFFGAEVGISFTRLERGKHPFQTLGLLSLSKGIFNHPLVL
jgi:hypothetical protein